MSGHTPGPWAWDAGLIPPDGPGRYSDIFVIDEDREPITIAEFNDSLTQGLANAQLIAAAPCLLEALEGAMDILGRAESNASGNPEWDYVGPRVANARAAIAKAKGQAS